MVELKPGATPPAKTVLHSPQGPGQNSKKLWQTPEIWDPPNLPVILEHPLTTCPETWDWGSQASSGLLGSKFSNCHFTPCSP
jgi:hypothetical protein